MPQELPAWMTEDGNKVHAILGSTDADGDRTFGKWHLNLIVVGGDAYEGRHIYPEPPLMDEASMPSALYDNECSEWWTGSDAELLLELAYFAGVVLGDQGWQLTGPWQFCEDGQGNESGFYAPVEQKG